MNISQKGIDLIKQFEGCRLVAYKPVPTERYWTIGYGHYGPDIKEHSVITKEVAEDKLKQDLEKFAIGVAAAIKFPVNQNQFDALVSFAYNCGIGNLQKSDLLKYVNTKQFQLAALEFAKWNHSGKNVLSGLVKRRQAECELFSTVDPVKERKIEILKPINLWKREGNKLKEVRTLKPGETYKIYGYDDLHGGQFNVGGGHWITNMKDYVKEL
jgi:GH24 family phage-related lysozyme (muramidase)